MFLDQDGLHLKARELHTHRRQKLPLIEEDTVVGISEVYHGRLLRLPQSTVVAVFSHTNAYTTLRGSDVNLDAQAGKSVDLCVYFISFQGDPCLYILCQYFTVNNCDGIDKRLNGT